MTKIYIYAGTAWEKGREISFEEVEPSLQAWVSFLMRDLEKRNPDRKETTFLPSDEGREGYIVEYVPSKREKK